MPVHQLPTAGHCRPTYTWPVLLSFLVLGTLTTPAAADQTYSVTGKDTFTIGTGDVRSEISYSGRESLRRRHGKAVTVYTATARYLRVDQGAASHVGASFVAEMAAGGEQHDLDDRDPDYLTVLNQPFAVQLDAATLRDLARLRNDVPFDFPSPMTGSSLRGRLRRVGAGIVSGAPALGVSFTAGGPMRGALPDRPKLSLNGRIRMQGQAYYRMEDALLVMLDATLTISGNLTNPDQTDEVTIVYRRTIRALKPETQHQHGP
jgi:hypothetical protein